MDLAIYGAQGYALGTYEAVKGLFPERKIIGFIVTEIGDNAPELRMLPVREIKTFAAGLSDQEKNGIQIVVATPENVQDEIEDTLERYGFRNHIRMTAERWDGLMEQYYGKFGYFKPIRSLPDEDHNPLLRIYLAKSHKDKPLKNMLELPEYYLPIQVGADNTQEIIADIRDNEGDSISKKNGNYCELTGLYWIWKNILLKNNNTEQDRDEYYGFAQYRRTLMISDSDRRKLCLKNVDVVLPYPLLYEPDINMHHKRYIKDTDWVVMTRAVREIQPEYADYLELFSRQKYLYNYNILLAKKDVLRDYCTWLFPILKRIEDLAVPKGSERSDRFIGYIGENLETLYFMKNADKLGIYHIGCKLHI